MRRCNFKNKMETKSWKDIKNTVYGKQGTERRDELEKDFERSERSTLFRTMKTFEEKGIVHQIEDGTGIIKYALCEDNCECEVGNDLHLHFHCNSCGETVCLTEHKIPTINLPEGYVAEDINLVAKGICEKCSDDLD